MNCHNCGAPLRPIPGRAHFCCEHCHSFLFPAALPDSPDRITPLHESADDVACPVCLTNLTHGALDGARVLFCETCRGILLESDALADVVGRRRADYEGADVTPVPLDRSLLERRVGCPHCGRNMEVHPYYGPGNAVIDSCARCRLVWIDSGELAAIERAPGRR
jgi:Zn-finger nucleic acid-binding protein